MNHKLEMTHKSFVNLGSRICEERDASSTIVKKFFSRGQTISGSNYFYFFDHLGSIRDMTDSSGVVQACYAYDVYGQRTKTTGALDSDFQYAGYYMHAPSGLNLTVYRAYNPLQGRWINRDPIEEDGGLNLYRYAFNKPTSIIDPSGLTSWTVTPQQVAQAFGIPNNFPGGCFDIINGATGNQAGVRPDNLPSTKCWYGANAQVEARKEAKKCCNGGVVWSKNGFWLDGYTPPGQAQTMPINPGMVSNTENVDYVTYNSNNGNYYDLDGMRPHIGHAYDAPPHGFPAQIWCSTCKNKK